MKWEKIFADHISNKGLGLIPKIYKVHIHLHVGSAIEIPNLCEERDFRNPQGVLWEEWEAERGRIVVVFFPARAKVKRTVFSYWLHWPAQDIFS